jgi:uncharacterized protein YkwD
LLTFLLIMDQMRTAPRQQLLVAIACSVSGAWASTPTFQPTELEQYMLQTLNRARADGGAEMVLRGNASNVNEGPPTLGPDSWSILNSAQPLAWSTALASSAQGHAANLQSADWFFNSSLYGGNPHSPNSSFPAGASTSTSRVAAAGYANTYSGCRSSTSGYLPGVENIASGVNSPSNGWSAAENLSAFNAGHEGLFEDFSVASRGHRSTMMYECFKEIGIGSAMANDFRSSDSTTWDSYYIVQNFGKSSASSNAFITGLAYSDVDNNQFFTPNASEAISGLTVQARQSGSVVATAVAFDTGGYSLPLAAGTYEIRFVKADGSYHNAGNVTLGTTNVALNVRNPVFVAPPLTYASWIATYPAASTAPGFTQDADRDGIINGVEQVLGTDPSKPTAGLQPVTLSGSNLKFRHTQTNTLASDTTISYQWSTDLQNWHASGATNSGGVSVTITTTKITDTAAPANDLVEATTTVTAGTTKRLYARLQATKP